MLPISQLAAIISTSSPGGATSFALSGNSSGTTNTPSTLTVTPNGPLLATTIVTLSITSGGGTLGTSTLTFTSGTSSSQSTTITRSTDGTTTLSMSNDKGLSNLGIPMSFSSGTAAVFASVALIPRTPWASTAPWTCGLLLSPGDVPLGETIGNAGGTLQVDIRNRHPDGSLKFAILSGITTSSNVTVLRGGTPASGTLVAEPTIAAVVTFTNVVDANSAPVAGGSFSADIATARTNGTMSWSRTTSHKVREILGPIMSEFHYFVPTADAHTYVWFYVRAYSSGDVELETVVENGWTMVAAPGRRTYDATVSINGSTRYSASGLVQEHHSRWSRVDWAGSDSAAVMTQDINHLRSVPGIPDLSVITLNTAAYTAQPSNGTKYSAQTKSLAEQPTPFEFANIDPTLGSGGYNDNVNGFAAWEMTFLAEGDVRPLYAMHRNSRAAGRWSIHYRDEANGRPVRASAYPTLAITNTNCGIANLNGSGATQTPVPLGNPAAPHWILTHAPSTGFLSYVTSGRWSVLEEIQFTSSACDLMQNAAYVHNGYRIASFRTQTREWAWGVRDRAQAAIVSPESLMGTTLTGEDAAQRTERIGTFNATIDWMTTTMVDGLAINSPSVSNASALQWADNALGIPYIEYNHGGTTYWHVAGMMQHFVTYTILWAAVARVTNNTNLDRLAVFVSRFVVGTLGAASSNGDQWDGRCWTWYSMPVGAIVGGDPNAPGALRTSWNDLWSFINTTPTWVARPDTLPVDNYLYRLGDAIDWFTNGNPMTYQKRITLTDSSSDVDAAMVSIAWAGTLAKRISIPGIEIAMSRAYQSATYLLNVDAYKDYPNYAYIPQRSPLPSWVPTSVGSSTLVPMSNTLQSVMATGSWSHGNTSSLQFKAYSGGVYLKWLGEWGGSAVHGGGHAATNDNSVFVANYNTLLWERRGNPSDIASKYVAYGSGSWSDSYEYLTAYGPNSTGYAEADINNVGMRQFPDDYTNPREYITGQPASAHTYDCLVALPPHLARDSNGGLLRPLASALSTIGSTRQTSFAHHFKMSAATWERFTLSPAGGATAAGNVAGSGGTTIYDPVRARVIPFFAGNRTHNALLRLITRDWDDKPFCYPSEGGYPDNHNGAFHVDADIHVVAFANNGDTTQSFAWYSGATPDGTDRTLVTWTNGTPPPSCSLISGAQGGGSLFYIPGLKKLIWWSQRDMDNLYSISVPVNLANPWTWSTIAITGASRPSQLSPAPYHSTYKCMDYSPSLKCIMYVTAQDLATGTFGGRVLAIRMEL